MVKNWTITESQQMYKKNMGKQYIIYPYTILSQTFFFYSVVSTSDITPTDNKLYADVSKTLQQIQRRNLIGWIPQDVKMWSVWKQHAAIQSNN